MTETRGRGSKLLLLLLGAHLFAVACLPAFGPPATTGVVIVIHRTGGFAGLDEELLVREDGRISYSNRKLERHAEFRVPRRDLEIFMERFRSLPEASVGEACPDCFIYKVSVSRGVERRSLTIHPLLPGHGEDSSAAELIRLMNRWFLKALEESGKSVEGETDTR